MTKTYEGRDAWKNHCSRNAADLLSICRWAGDWDLETFLMVLMRCFHGMRGDRISENRVCRVLQQLADEKDMCMTIGANHA